MSYPLYDEDEAYFIVAGLATLGKTWPVGLQIEIKRQERYYKKNRDGEKSQPIGKVFNGEAQAEAGHRRDSHINLSRNG